MALRVDMGYHGYVIEAEALEKRNRELESRNHRLNAEVE